MRVRAELTDFRSRAILHMVDDSRTDGKLDVVTNLHMTTIDRGAYHPPSPVELSITEAQELMDSLWQCGLRPSEGSGSAGALAATERHLRDMQRLVFKLKPGETL